MGSISSLIRTVSELEQFTYSNSLRIRKVSEIDRGNRFEQFAGSNSLLIRAIAALDGRDSGIEQFAISKSGRVRTDSELEQFLGKTHIRPDS